MWGIIAISELLFAHLTTDRDFPEDIKTVAWGVFIVIALVYIIVGLIL